MAVSAFLLLKKLSPILMVMAISTVMKLLDPVFQKMGYTSQEALQSTLPQIGDLIQLRHKGQVTEYEYVNLCAKNGFDSEFASKLYKSSENLLSINDGISSWRRGIITEPELDTLLLKYGYENETINNLKKVSLYFPSVSDLVSFAVREVYTPQAVQEFGLDKDRPPQFMTEAKKAGLDEEQAKNYWKAHWVLPSVGQGFEMYHRGVINVNQLNSLLKALDIVPAWRDKLTHISYNTLTRVDVRRMFDIGVLTESEVNKSYLDFGYSPENALKMTEFTKKYVRHESTDLSRSTIIKAYKQKVINLQKCTTLLQEIGYKETDINVFISLADYEILEEQIENYVQELISLYRMGNIPLSIVRQNLTAYNLPAEYINNILTKEELRKSVKLKMPSKSDIENWLKLSIINEADYNNYMINLGYQPSSITKYLTEIALELDTSKVKYLPIKTYVRWFKSGIMEKDQFVNIARELKISSSDIQNFIQEVESQQPEE